MRESCTSKITGCHAEIKFLRKFIIFQNLVHVRVYVSVTNAVARNWRRETQIIQFLILSVYLKDKKCPVIFIIINFFQSSAKFPI